MARSRIELQTLLEDTLGSGNVYFQPPPNIEMKYPAIVYNREADNVHHADDSGYLTFRRYHLTVIDRDPDSAIAERVNALRYCRFVNAFALDGLNQFTFTINF